jgi:hypothetical protein
VCCRNAGGGKPECFSRADVIAPAPIAPSALPRRRLASQARP